jgi:hypothetical protein
MSESPLKPASTSSTVPVGITARDIIDAIVLILITAGALAGLIAISSYALSRL